MNSGGNYQSRLFARFTGAALVLLGLGGTVSTDPTFGGRGNEPTSLADTLLCAVVISLLRWKLVTVLGMNGRKSVGSAQLVAAIRLFSVACVSLLLSLMGANHAGAAAPVTTTVTDATPVQLASGHNVMALYRTSNQVTGHVDPGTLLPRVRVTPADFPDAFRGLWGADGGELGAWLAPGGYLQFSPSSIYVGSSYFANATLPTEAPPFEKTGSLPMDSGDQFELVMGDVVANTPLPGDLLRGAANGQLEWDYAATTQRLTASYAGVSGASDVLLFRADVVARGGDVDARSAQISTPPLLINLPSNATTGTVSYMVSVISPYTYYLTFNFRVVPDSNMAVLIATVHGYISQAREYELPNGGEMNEWHLPIVGIITVNPAGTTGPQAVSFMGRRPADAVVSAGGGGVEQILNVPAGSSIVAGAELPPKVLGPPVSAGNSPELITSSSPASGVGEPEKSRNPAPNLGVPPNESKMTEEFAAAEAIGPATAAAINLELGGGKYSATFDPDYQGLGILALRNVVRSADGALISSVSAVPFVVIEGQSITLDQSRLIDLRVIPTIDRADINLTGGGGGTPPTPTMEEGLSSIDFSGGHVDAVYDLGQGRFAFLTFEITQFFPSDFGHITVTAIARSLSRDPVGASFVQYGELAELGPVFYDNMAWNSESSAPLDVTGKHTSITANAHTLSASIGSSGHDGIVTALTAPAQLTPFPTADPGISIVGQNVAYFYSSPDFASNYSVVVAQLNQEVTGYPAVPPLGQSCDPPEVVESTALPDAPPPLDIQSAWFDSDAVNLYLSIQVADLPQNAPANTTYWWTLHWRANDSTWYARASLDPNGKWSFDFGFYNGGFNHLADVAGELVDGANGVLRMTVPRNFYGFANGDLLRDTGAHSFTVIDFRAEEIDSVPDGANDTFGSGGDYVIEPPCVPALLRVLSRKPHGTAGNFDIDLPYGATPGVECRSGGPDDEYTLVFTFTNPLTSVSSASVTNGTGSVSSSNIDPNDAHNYVVNLAGVANAQYLTVALANVADSAGNTSASLPVTMGVLIGDVNASGRVDAADVSSVRQQTLQTVEPWNFRNDINASGRIDAADVSIARQQTLTSLP